jgi:hypothetical protein
VQEWAELKMPVRTRNDQRTQGVFLKKFMKLNHLRNLRNFKNKAAIRVGILILQHLKIQR